MNANYGYAERRQINFATVGEGNLIVRDGNTDISKLNRDVTTARYGTVDVGFKGGVTIDSSTVAMITSPIKTAKDTYNALKTGYIDAKETTVGLYEKTGNLVGGDGFYTDGEIRIQKAIASGTAMKYGSLDYFSNKIEMGYYGEGGEGIQLVRDDQGRVTALVERSADGTGYGVYKYDSGSALFAALDYTVDNPNFNRTGNLTKEDYRNNTTYVFGVIKDVSESAGITKNDRLFNFTVEGARSYFSNLTFADQGQLNYTYAGIMDNLGYQFDGKISYSTNAVIINGPMAVTSSIDCSSYTVTGIHILGLDASLKTGTAVNPQYYNSSDFRFTPTGKWITSTANGPAVLTYNESVVTRYDASTMNGIDKTGMIGITIINQGKIFHDYKLDHAYVSLDEKAGTITESYGPTYGIKESKKNPYLGKRRDTKYYLQLNLLDERKAK